MSQCKDPRSCKSQLRGWSTMIFHTVIILQLTHINGGESPANSQHRMLAVIGHTQSIILPCSVSPVTDVVDEMVEWSRSDLNPRFVHVRRSGEDLMVDQNPSYKNRTSMSVDGLKMGDASLKLTKVRLSDEGTYRCFVPRLKTDFSVELVVEADIQITKVSPGELECKSEGWYPEPEVFWLERERKLISAGSKETFRGPDDLSTISSRLTLEKGHSNNFTCRIQQNNLQREATIYVPDDFFVESSSSTRSVIGGLIAGIMFVSVVLFLVWKWRKNKMENKKSCKDGESQSRREDNRFSEDPETKPLMNNEEECKGRSEALLVRGKVEVNQPAYASKQHRLSCENKHGFSNCPPQITQSERQQNNDQPERDTTNEMRSDEVTQSGEKNSDLAVLERHPEPLETNIEVPNESLMDSSVREDSICSSNKKPEKESLTKNEEACKGGSEAPMVRGSVEVNTPAYASKEPELLCENEHLSNYPPEITQSERHQNNDQPERDTTNEMCSDEKTQLGDNTPALTEIKTHPEPVNRNTEKLNQSLMDSSGKQQQLKQGEEAKNDTDTKEDKKKAQTINDETAGPCPSAEEGEPKTDGQINSEFQKKDINGERTETTNLHTTHTPEKNVSEPNSAKVEETAEGQDNREDSLSAEEPENKERESGNISATDKVSDGGDQQEENSTKSKDAISALQVQNNDDNLERTQTVENKTTDSTDKSTSQNDHAVGGESQNGQDATETGSKPQPDTQPSHPEENGTSQVPPTRTEQPNIKEEESRTTSATEDSSVNGYQQQQSIKSQNTTSDQEAQNDNTNREKTEATNVAETADSPGRHVSPTEGEEAKKGQKEDSKPKSDVQATDPDGTNQNPSGNTEYKDNKDIQLNLEDPINDGNEEKTETANNKMADSTDMSQDDQAEGEDTKKRQDDTEKGSKRNSDNLPIKKEVEQT